jgi:hypothetical protein
MEFASFSSFKLIVLTHTLAVFQSGSQKAANSGEHIIKSTRCETALLFSPPENFRNKSGQFKITSRPATFMIARWPFDSAVLLNKFCISGQMEKVLLKVQATSRSGIGNREFGCGLICIRFTFLFL